MTHATGTGDPSIKFCGLTRDADITLASTLGAAFVGGILAGGPRVLSADVWRARFGVHRAANDPARVAVIGALALPQMLQLVADLSPDVLQLHGDPEPALVTALRQKLTEQGAGAIAIWPVLRVAGARLPREAFALAESADALVLDAKVAGTLGGTGVALDWKALADDVFTWRVEHPSVRLTLAGGLTPENVATAVDLLAPDVVDVSSGVETAPGIKDPARMRAFVNAVHLREQRG